MPFSKMHEHGPSNEMHFQLRAKKTKSRLNKAVKVYCVPLQLI